MTEGILTQQVADYLRLQYSWAPFHVDFGAGAVLNKLQAIRSRRLNDNGWPDIAIPVARHGKHGLYIELKKDGVAFYKKNGEPYSQFAHQHAVHELLRAQGYEVVVGIGFNRTKQAVDNYLAQMPTSANI